ncbi:MAG TPA: maleylpyruvate isomerase family mycothiol-dependent enzyme [Acidimicrobiia bacterium]|nr:maleylpyruvate isomerase family mycothiol-dependent enzyme [Acidimicrobiia bacterium]
MAEWNFMDYDSKDNLLRTIREEAATMLTLASEPGVWEQPTGAGHWQVRDIIGHLVDTTEGYFKSFDAARGNGPAPEALGVRGMNEHVDAGAQQLRGTPQGELLERLQTDNAKMMDIFDALTEDEWGGLLAPHGYMGPLPSFFYPIFQLVDYALHNWDIREGRGMNHGLDGDSADLLVPLNFILWTATHNCTPETEPFEIGVRVTGRNGGETKLSVGPEGVAFEPGDISNCPAMLEFDPGTLILTAYQRMNAGTSRGDQTLIDRFRNLFFKI